jgi:hypothetical protein
MNREEFIKAQNSPDNLKAREQNVAFMSKLIASQSDLCHAYNIQKKEIIKHKYLESKNKRLSEPRVFKCVG